MPAASPQYVLYLYPGWGYNECMNTTLHPSSTAHAKRQAAQITFKKAHSLLARIQKMLDDDAYCIDIMQQNLAAIGLLKSAHQQLMEDHLTHCFSEAMRSSSAATKARMTEEILTVTKLAGR